MARPKKEAEATASVSVLILRDGVFIADDVRHDEGDQCFCELWVAKVLIEHGHAKSL